ncbi:hypothetical protein B0T14DRAFT_561688 [Immersiella caudata]|uniref:Uncharacterized protein n=1 Tax=Immersiella caudata TaxID=314043 RepID=A0AA39XHM7_9PEZI|nr:hypothetical protein B0T14DRAFT_561688 [Immersiella caudata]
MAPLHHITATVLMLLHLSSAATRYVCSRKHDGLEPVYCGHTSTLLIHSQTGCDGKTWIPNNPVQRSYGQCTVQIQSTRGGQAVGVYTLYRLLGPLVNRCATGSFCDDDTGICASLSSPAPAKRDVDEEDELSWTAFNSSEADPSLSSSKPEPEHALSLTRRHLTRRQGNGCKTPTDKYNFFTEASQYTFRRITVVKQHNVDTLPIANILQNLSTEMIKAIRSKAGQSDSNIADYFSITGRNLGPYPNGYASAVAIPQTGTQGENSGYRTWADVAKYFNADVLENFVKKSIGDLQGGPFLAGVYELVDSGNNGVVRLLITAGMKGSGQPTKPN